MQTTVLNDKLWAGLAHAAPPITLLLRTLWDLRDSACLIGGTSLSRSVRALNSDTSTEWNPYLLTLKATALAKKLNGILHTIEVAARTSDHPQIDFAQTAVQGHWMATAELMCASEPRLIRRIFDATDMYARIAEFYFERPTGNAERKLGELVSNYYVGKEEDDIIAPGKLPMEVPLRRLLDNLHSYLAKHIDKDPVVLDYGAGLDPVLKFLESAESVVILLCRARESRAVRNVDERSSCGLRTQGLPVPE